MNVGWSAISEIPERFVMEINDRIKEDVAKARTLEFDESRRILDQAKSVLSKKYRNINILTKIGDPATEILDEAEKLQSHIIAVGSRGLKGIKGMMGSVSRTILGHSKCSVFVGK
jgi:nucleotide-binding universal stress UspA family protein